MAKKEVKATLKKKSDKTNRTSAKTTSVSGVSKKNTVKNKIDSTTVKKKNSKSSKVAKKATSKRSVNKVTAKNKSKNENAHSENAPVIETEIIEKQNISLKKNRKSRKDEIIALKRKMHFEIFNKCLEKKLRINADSWSDEEENILDDEDNEK